MVSATTPVQSANMNASIVPGDGVADLKLGQSLYEVVNHFTKLNQQLKISYSSKEYLDNPILVTIPNYGIRLMFDNYSKQSLILIEATDFNHSKFSYNGHLLNEIIINQLYDSVNSTPDKPIYKTDKSVIIPNLKQIYNKTFGPTYPGKLNYSKQIYTLSYPGISFNFKIELNDLLSKVRDLTDDSTILSKLINWNKASDIPAINLAIFKGDNYSEFHKKLLEKKSKPIVDFNNSDEKDGIKVLKVLPNHRIKLIFNSGSDHIIEIGKTTQQDILTILGPPDDYFNKFDSRLLIHNHLKNLHFPNNSNLGNNDNSIYKFHNYFNHGLDFLYDLKSNQNNNTGILTKVIIHNGGITESLDFMRWNKCNWELNICDITIDSSTYFNQIPSKVFQTLNDTKNPVLPSDIKPVLLNRNESEFIDDDLEVIQSDDLLKDPTQTNSISSDQSNNHRTWGQSKLYGFNGCILEVIESNNCISCLTIY